MPGMEGGMPGGMDLSQMMASMGGGMPGMEGGMPGGMPGGMDLSQMMAGMPGMEGGMPDLDESTPDSNDETNEIETEKSDDLEEDQNKVDSESK